MRMVAGRNVNTLLRVLPRSGVITEDIHPRTEAWVFPDIIVRVAVKDVKA